MRRVLLLVGAGALGSAIALDAPDAWDAMARTWAPFVLVVGLLLVGRVAAADGLFEWAAGLTLRLRGGSRALLVVLLLLVAVVTAIVNLDTAVVFLTPVLVLAARRRGVGEEPFLYGALFMANAGSLLLPGSNLTNLLVDADDRPSGWRFARDLGPAWVAAVGVTIAVLLVRHRAGLRRAVLPLSVDDVARPGAIGLAATSVAAALVLVLPEPAVPVLLLGTAACLLDLDHVGGWRRVVADLDLPVLVGLFGVAAALGTLAASWSGPSELLDSASAPATAALAAVAAVVVNNLPAAVLLSARAPVHREALLIGLNIGPNLAVTGSLSALLWYRAAQTVGAKPSIRKVSTTGIVLAPLSIAAALLAVAHL